jgi:hypothetical protein
MSTANSEPPAAGWGFVAPDDVRDPNSHPHAGVSATFRDGSQVTLAHLGVDDEGRQRYTYALTDSTGNLVEAGDDLRSGVGDPVNHSRTLAAWTSFAGADAETYQSAMDGTPMQEWAYMHDGELGALSCELEPNPDSGDDADPSEADPNSPTPDEPTAEPAGPVDHDDDTDGM